MSISFEYTSTTTLTSTFTVPPPTPTLPIPSDSASSPAPPPGAPPGAPVIYSTLPDADPSAAKLIPVLVVTEYYITITGGNGEVTGYTTTHVTPNVVITLPSESGAAATVETDHINGLKAIGWESWSGKERWAVLAALGVGIALLLAGAGWLLWVKFGRGRSKEKQRKSGAAKMGGLWFLSSGDDKSVKNRWPAGREQSTGSQSRREDTDRRGRRPSNARFQMSGGLGYPESEMSERSGSRQLLL